MTFYITYRGETKKIVQAVVIDNRVALGLQGENGNVIQPYVDAIVLAIGPSPYFYVIETNENVLCGYFYLSVVHGVATIGGKNFRPSFSSYSVTFDVMISNFILSNDWQFDVLY